VLTQVQFVKRLLTQLLISFEITSNIKIPSEPQMNDAPSYSEAADRLHSEKSAPEAPAAESKIDGVAEKEHGRGAAKTGHDGERIKSSVALFTSKSIKELEGLTSELNELQEYLKSETERVQGDIDSALAGLRVIIDTISPLRNALPVPVQEKPTRPEPRMQRSTLTSGQR
jgi:hypothetical protein